MMICSRRIRSLLHVATFGVAAFSPFLANAAELLMFTRADCVYCLLWERQIEPIYGKTDEAVTAPLRKVRTDRPLPEDAFLTPPVRVTPTFVLMENGREVGRFAGYNDDATFWANLGMLLRRLDDQTPSDSAPQNNVVKTHFENLQ